MASRTNQATWSNHDSKWNLCDSIWNRQKGGNVEVILDQKDLGITNRLRRTQGRPNRTRSIATRFTPDEEKELKVAAAARGSFIAEWAREVLLCEARTRRFDAAVITEVVALRMLGSRLWRRRPLLRYSATCDPASTMRPAMFSTSTRPEQGSSRHDIAMGKKRIRHLAATQPNLYLWRSQERRV